MSSDLTSAGGGSGITALTGDVTASGTGSVPSTIANDAVTYAKIQNVSATDKLLGRSAAGAGDVQEITCTAAGRALIDDADAAAQRTTMGVADFTGDSGAGGTAGRVPAPAVGDASKFLKGNGTWATPASGPSYAVLGTQFDTTSLTPADTGLSVSLTAGNRYVFEVRVGQTIDAIGAAAISLVFSGTSSALLVTAAYYDGNNAGAVVAIGTGNNFVAVDKNFTGSDAGTSAYVYFGAITVSGSGTLSLQYAQRNVSVSPSSVLVGSSILTQVV